MKKLTCCFKYSGTALFLLIQTNPSEFSSFAFYLFVSTLPSIFSYLSSEKPVVTLKENG